MSITPHTWRSAVALNAEPTTLTERAAYRLAQGPLDAVTLMRTVCHVERLSADAAERMARALLGGRQEFVRLSDGAWALADDPSLGANGSNPARTVADGEDPPLASLSFAVVDTETTGTSPRRSDRITEVAVVRVSGGAITDVWSQLVNPERPIPAMITSLTQISWEMVKDAPLFRDLAADVGARLTGHVFTAHNAEFDWRFVSEELSRAIGRRLHGPRLCTVRLSRALLPELSRRSLDHVTRHFGIDVSARHRAEGDAVATAKVLIRLLEVAADRDISTWSGLMLSMNPQDRASKRTASAMRRRAFPHPVNTDDIA